MAGTISYSSTVYKILQVPSTFDPNFSLVTSPIFSPLALALIRLTLALYGTAFLIITLVRSSLIDHDGKRYFSFFTELSYIGLVAYLWAAAVQTLFFARSRAVYPLQYWPRPLQFLHLLLQSTTLTYPILVTAVFWGVLSSPETLATRWSAWTNISEHALNTVFAAFEIFCTNASPSFGANPNALSMPWIHIPFLIIMLAGYLGVAYITHATQGFYTYSFLDPNHEHSKLAAYIVGIGAAAVVAFIIVRYICMGRAWIVSRFGSPILPAEEIRGSSAYQDDLESVPVSRKFSRWPSIARDENKEGLEDWEKVSGPVAPGAKTDT